MWTAHTIKVRYSLQQLLQRRKNTYLTRTGLLTSPGSLRFRTESSDSEEEFPMSAHMGRNHPIVEVQSSSPQARSIGATCVDGDGDGIETEAGIQEKRVRERNKDKGKSKMEISLNDHGLKCPVTLDGRGANLALRGERTELPAP
jgi:hypothetical protein